MSSGQLQPSCTEVDRGFLKLHRSILDWEWYTDPIVKTLFIHLLLRANYKPTRWHGIEIGVGQLVTSFASLAENSGLSVQNTRTALKRLKSSGEIDTKSTRSFTIITLRNYGKYNDTESTSQHTANIRLTHSQHTANIQLTTDKKVRKKESKKDTPPAMPAGFVRFWEEYPKKTGKQAALRAWKRAKLPDIGTVIASLEAQKGSDQWTRDGGRYIPNPATWINQGRWEDEIEGQAAVGAPMYERVSGKPH
jgi:hypothetical protein